MASPQVENGYLKISNELFDAILSLKISGSAFQILNVIFRKTYGYHKKSDRISLKQFENLTGIKSDNCPRIIQKLEKMNIIIVDRTSRISRFQIQKNYEIWTNSVKIDTVRIDTKNSVRIDTETVSELTLKTVSELTLTKDKKDTFTKESKNKETSYLFFLKNLFITYTKIQNPNLKFHLNPILKFFENIPIQLNEENIKEIITETFKKLKPKINIRIDFLWSNIQNNISAVIENIELRKKQEILSEAKKDKKKERKENYNAEQEKEIESNLLKTYQTFYINNSESFNSIEKLKLTKLFAEKKLLQIGSIIEPKLKR